MTLILPHSTNAVAPHFEPEDLMTFAHGELVEWTPWEKGICFNPGCGRVFTPSRDWQVYCCPKCKAAGTAEMRKWGHRMALSTLIWRMGKYEKTDPAVRGVTNAARRHIQHVTSAWLADRQARASEVIR
ncbi:hypothetical protein [Ruegeria sp. Ofav3-42]|uniref:hypothetical protein n=1 Tax=Ruegeria sp. Ofav3-42 TaxID=2917759 RepID=UPI001EF44D64|nr:hypothetical protein [Ruegeria sp. Ofav3-42]MCG7520863.1 hypothetical protein [Ruegeria sp. Ofav3-42]